jgi:hypothetical protein
MGSLLGGVLSDALGASLTLLVVGASMTVACGWLFVSPLRGVRTVSEARQLVGPVALDRRHADVRGPSTRVHGEGEGFHSGD